MEKQRKKQKKKLNNKKVIVISGILLVLLIYLIYVIYLLIKQPTNVFTVEEGKLYKEETDKIELQNGIEANGRVELNQLIEDYE